MKSLNAEHSAMSSSGSAPMTTNGMCPQSPSMVSPITVNVLDFPYTSKGRAWEYFVVSAHKV